MFRKGHSLTPSIDKCLSDAQRAGESMIYKSWLSDARLLRSVALILLLSFSIVFMNLVYTSSAAITNHVDTGTKHTFIFYNGIPKTGTSSLRLSMIETNQFDVKDVPFWGCKLSVAEGWRRIYHDDIYRKANHSMSVFATGHACWVNFTDFSEQPFKIQTVRDPLSRWESSFNYLISSKRGKDRMLKYREYLRMLLNLNDPFSPDLTFANCVESDLCFEKVIIGTALQEREAFIPCEFCDVEQYRLRKKMKDKFKAMTQTDVYGITPARSELLSGIKLMLEYDALIPVEDMEVGLKLLQRKWPSIFGHAVLEANFARVTSTPRYLPSNKPLQVVHHSKLKDASRMGGFELAYQVACARHCLEAYNYKLRTAFCKDVFFTSGKTTEYPWAGVGDRFLLWTSSLKGGLHNQLLALVHLGEIALQLNRTLVVPQVRHGFPTERHLHTFLGNFEDVYNISYLRTVGFPSYIVTVNEVPAGLFLGDIDPIDLDLHLGSRNLRTESRQKKLRDILESQEKVQLLVVKRDNSQEFPRQVSLSGIYNNFKVVEKLSVLVDDCVKLLFGTPSIVHEPWRSVVFLHARIEEDFQSYSRRKVQNLGGRLEEWYQTISQVRLKFNNITINKFLERSTHTPLVMLVSYAAGKLPNALTPHQIKQGWPRQLRIITADDLESVLSDCSYLEKTVILSQIALKAEFFVGNSASSFSQVIRRARAGKENFKYNTLEAGLASFTSKKESLY